MKKKSLLVLPIVIVVIVGIALLVFKQHEESTPITNLVKQLQKTRDENQRKSLINELKNVTPEKGVDFKTMAGSQDAQVRSRLLEAIQKSDRFKPEWIEMLDANKRDVDLVGVVIGAIARLTNKEDAPLLLALLKKRIDSTDTTDTLLTQAVVAALATMKEEKAMKILMQRPELYFGHGGGSPLAQFGAAALPALKRIANNPRNKMAWDAGRVIAQINDPKAVPMLMELAKTGKKDAKLGAVSALAAMKVKEAEPVFQELLNDQDFNVRQEVIGALLASDFEGNFDKGVKVLESDDVGAVKSAVMEQMVQHKGSIEKVEEVIKKRTDDPRYDVREESMRKLMELDYEKFRSFGLEKMTKDEDWKVREKLANYFADKRDKKAVGFLKTLLKDDKDRVRFAASRALLLITKQKYQYEETEDTKEDERDEMDLNPEYRELNK